MRFQGEYYTENKQDKSNINYFLSLDLESLDAYGRDASFPETREREDNQ